MSDLVKELLAVRMSPVQQQADSDLVELFFSLYQQWYRSAGRPVKGLADQRVLLIRCLKDQLEQLQDTARKREIRYRQFVQQVSHAGTKAERHQSMEEFSRYLGFSERAIAGDRKALNRWFDEQAMKERFLKRQSQSWRQLSFCCNRLGIMVSEAFLEQGDSVQFWRGLDLENYLVPLFSHTESRLACQAIQCLSDALQGQSERFRAQALSAGTLQYVYRFSMARREDSEVQKAALKLLAMTSAAHFYKIATARLQQPSEGDDFYIRSYITQLLTDYPLAKTDLAKLVAWLVKDPSARVRQQLCHLLVQGSDGLFERYYPHLALSDSSEQVRAEAFLALEHRITDSNKLKLAIKLIRHSLRKEQSIHVNKVVLLMAVRLPESFWQSQGLHSSSTVRQGALIQKERNQDDLKHEAKSGLTLWVKQLTPEVEHFRHQTTDIALRRWCAQMQERLWLLARPERYQFFKSICTELQQVAPGKTKRFSSQLMQGFSEEEMGRILSVVAQDDFGFQIELMPWGIYLSRGHQFGFRFWRFWHELIHPATDKRQAFRHTVGRIFKGTVRIPSSILAEQSETRVPGEPRYLDGEQGWRPYLPLVDELLSALDEGYPVRVINSYTPEGITKIQAPKNPITRLKARWALNFRYAELNKLRNWQEGDNTQPDSYLSEIYKLGFRISMVPHKDQALVDAERQLDVGVQRFFPGRLPTALLPLSVEQLGGQLHDYFFSLYENTIFHLGVFLGGLTLLFYSNHWRQIRQMRSARRAIPLVIGGWGTRGKSGTERLKAAVSNALGYSLISKTTGCEAMFLYAYDYGPLTELFLFRPYDKATIWEQKQVVEICRDLKGKVFLWECMALTPEYVRILQQQWMQDDYLTLTNTFPDHEDLQGPAGINIPQVMTEFIPANKKLFTTEEVMRPILADAARNRNTAFYGVGWLEAGQLTPEQLERFPYAEHPYNIALVARMFQEMGVDYDYAIKAMADCVIPDIGVLSTTPLAQVRGRKIQFINGMSANERLGCMGNWQRTGLVDETLAKAPGSWLCTVVNNREDRIARSKVFADILVNDLSADCHLLIGNNLDGMMNYINEAWAARMGQFQLWLGGSEGQGSDNQAALQRFDELCREQRVPVTEQELLTRLAAITGDDLPEASVLAEGSHQQVLDACPVFQQQVQQAYDKYQALHQKITAANNSDRKALTQEVQEQLKQWFLDKIVVIEDYYASGDDLIHELIEHTPPGLTARVIGLQNIKGTGLGLVYRFQNWDQTAQGLKKLQDDDPFIAEQGLNMLSGMQDFSVLSYELLKQVFADVRCKSLAQSEHFQAELAFIEQRQSQVIKAESGKSKTKKNPWLEKIRSGIEAFLDSGDAIKRRKHSYQVYDDLINERISVDRAAHEIKQLNQRQKGGWLLRDA